jgi:HlyD family secretion protein
MASRVVEVLFREGDAIPARAVIARLDTSEIRARIATKEREIAMLDADAARAEQQLELVRNTSPRDVEARRAEARRIEATSRLASRTFDRTAQLERDGVSSAQHLDDMRARRDESTNALVAAREMLERARAETRSVDVAQGALVVTRERRALAAAQLDELRVTEARHEIRGPDVATVLQTQFVWPGELAQPGSAIAAVLDPEDKYVQIYLPASDVTRIAMGTRVTIELDGAPGRRVPGEVSFIADRATFTPEKIESRGDRLGQVYRAKVRILEGARLLPAGAEGNVYPDDTPVVASREAQ